MDPHFAGGGNTSSRQAHATGALGRAGVIVNPPSDVLLPPEYFTTTTASHVMQNVDMTPSRFNNVINFDALASGTREDLNVSSSSAGATGINPDLMAQQQSMKQAELVARFRELRGWQAKQQELLIKQQQEELEKLQGKQEQFQKIYAQRQRAWGGGSMQQPKQQAQGALPNGRSYTPPNQATVSPQQQNNSTPPKHKPPSGRPVPNLPSVPSTPSEYRENGNPDLDSDTASEASVHDFQPLPPDTASEVSNNNSKGFPTVLRQSKPPRPKTLSRYMGDSESEAGSEYGGKSPRRTLNFSNLTNMSLMSEKSDSGKAKAKKGNEERPEQQENDREEFSEGPRGVLNIGEAELLQLIQQAGITDEATIVALLKDQLGRTSYAEDTNTSGNNNSSKGYYEGSQGGVKTTGVDRQALHGDYYKQQTVREATEEQFQRLTVHPNNQNGGFYEAASEQRNAKPGTHSQPQNRGYVDGPSEGRNIMSLPKTSGPNSQPQNGGYFDGPSQERNVKSLVRTAGVKSQPQNGGYFDGPSQGRNVTSLAKTSGVQSQPQNGFVPPNQESQNGLPDRFTVAAGGLVGYAGYIEETDVMIEVADTEARDPFNHYQYHSDERMYMTEGYPVTAKPPGQQFKTVNYQKAGQEEEESFVSNLNDEEEEEEEEYEEEDEVEEEEEEEAEQEPKSHDERPVGGLGARKTFEQLLEEELRKEQQQQSSVPSTETALSNSKANSVFLKKGEGLARFGMKGKKTAQKKNITGKKFASTAPSIQSNSVKPAISKQPPPNAKLPPKAPAKMNKKTESQKLDKPLKLLGKRQTEENSGRRKLAGSTAQKGTVAVDTAARDTERQDLRTTGDRGSSEESGKSDDGASVRNDAMGDVSFQKVMKKKKVEAKIEEAELDEFEILEQYADDNASFLSNVSAVNRVLNKHKKTSNKPSATERPAQNNGSQSSVHPAYRSSSSSSSSESDSDEDATTADSDSEMDKTLEYKSPASKPQQQQQQQAATKDDALTVRTLQRKIVSIESRSPNTDTHEPNTNTNHKVSETGTVGKKRKNLSSNNAQSGHPLQERQQPSSSDDEALLEGMDLEETEDEELAEDDEDEDAMDFCDDEVWDDSQLGTPPYSALSQQVQSGHRPAPIKKEIVDYIATGGASSGSSIDTGANIPLAGQSTSTTAPPPPTSQLVTKLFPSLKPPPPQPVQPAQKEVVRQPAADGISSKLVRDKLAELETEIEKFRQENANLERLRREREQGLDHLKKEMAEFEKQKDNELQRIKDMKEEETRKLKKERRVFEQYQKTSRPDKKDREEIEALRQQVEDLQEEARRKETRFNAATSRLRDRVELLDTENGELKNEIAFLEKKRLEGWQSREAGGGGGLMNSGKVPASTFPPPPKRSSGHPGSSKQQQVEPSVRHKERIADPGYGSKDSTGRGSKDSTGRGSKDSTGRGSKDSTGRGSKDSTGRGSKDSTGRGSKSSTVRSQIAESEVTIGPEDSASNILSNSADGVPQPMQRRRSLAPTPQPERIDGVPSTHASPLPRKRATTTTNGARLSYMDKGDEQYDEVQHTDGKVERVYSNAAREILFPNGTRKQISGDGRTTIVSFFNGDIKQILPDKRVVYYYADADTLHTNYPDGLETVTFTNGQEEKYYPDGTKEIQFTDQTIKFMFPNGVEESIYLDGTVIRHEVDGTRTVKFANGQQEIHTPHYKKREYPDGTVKTIYPDGRQETRYSSGRFRVKDGQGNIVVDQRM